MITFPCFENKRPKIKEWQKLSIAKPHQANDPYGILCGKLNGIVVVDCDVLKESDPAKFVDGVDAWKRLTDENKYLIDTLLVQTPSGGLHIYFKYRDDIIHGVTQLNDGVIGGNCSKKIKIDILSNNRFVMGYDSPGYRVVSGSIENLSEMPKWLYELLKLATSHARKVETRPLKKFCDKYAFTGRHFEIDKEQLREVVLGLDDSVAETRDTWCKVLWALHDTAKSNGYDALDIADEFSKKAPLKYKGIEDVKYVYEQSNGKTTWIAIKNLREQKNYGILVDHLRQRFPQLGIQRIIEVKAGFQKNEWRISYLTNDNGSEKTLVLLLDLLMRLRLPNREFFGCFTDTIEAHGPLQLIDSRFTNENLSVIKFREKDVLFEQCVQGDENAHCFKLVNPENPETSFIERDDGKVVLTKKLKNMCSKIIADSARRELGSKFGNIFIYNQINVFQNFKPNDDGESVRPEKLFIDSIEVACPNLHESYRSVLGSAVYTCDKQTKIWRKLPEFSVHDAIIKLLQQYVVLSKKEARIINTTFVKQLKVFFRHAIYDDTFLENLDADPYLFAFKDCVMCLHDPRKTYFRDTQWDDYVQTTCGWSYSASLSEKYMDAVKKFFKCVLPRADERECVLTYFAKLLCGKRNSKYFLVLTDKRAGYNGKSTMMNLLRKVFGRYTISGKKYVCQATQTGDRNTHDEGLFKFKGKRLLVVDELKKNLTLDCAFLKGVTGGQITIDGRNIYASDAFEFIWETGIVLTFNEDDCPHFDVSDEAFIERMIVCPFRSKFVKNHNEALLEENTFVADENIVDLFPLWRSAVIDYLRSFFALEIKVPKSMVTWRDEICGTHDDVACWLDENTIKTGNEVDMVTLRNVQENFLIRKLNKREIRGSMKKYARKNKLKYHEVFRPRINGIQTYKTDVIVGVKIT